MPDSFTFAQFMQLMSLGATFVFFVFVLWFVAKYGPKYVDAKKLEAEADKELALALAGLQGEIRYSRETCSKAQDGMVMCTQETEDRLGKQVEDLKRVCVNTLERVQNIDNRQLEHMKSTTAMQQTTEETRREVQEHHTWHKACEDAKARAKQVTVST